MFWSFIFCQSEEEKVIFHRWSLKLSDKMGSLWTFTGRIYDIDTLTFCLWSEGYYQLRWGLRAFTPWLSKTDNLENSNSCHQWPWPSFSVFKSLKIMTCVFLKFFFCFYWRIIFERKGVWEELHRLFPDIELFLMLLSREYYIFSSFCDSAKPE